MKAFAPVIHKTVRLTRRDKGAREYTETWELRDGFWHMCYDSDGTSEYEAIDTLQFSSYSKCFHDIEEVAL